MSHAPLAATGLLIATLAYAAAAVAGDVKLIKQPSTFPLVISKSGSYRLKSNITVPDANTTAIDVQADDVTIDLNGWSIRGPVTCTGSPVTSCSASGSGRGIDAGCTSTARVGTTVRNGVIRGMGEFGLCLGDQWRVENVTVVNNASDGIKIGFFIHDGMVSSSIVKANGGNGIDLGGGTVVDSVIIGNKNAAVTFNGGGTMANVVAYSNGLTSFATVVANSTVDKISGQVVVGTNGGDISAGVLNASSASNIDAFVVHGSLSGNSITSSSIAQVVSGSFAIDDIGGAYAVVASGSAAYGGSITASGPLVANGNLAVSGNIAGGGSGAVVSSSAAPFGSISGSGISVVNSSSAYRGITGAVVSGSAGRGLTGTVVDGSVSTVGTLTASVVNASNANNSPGNGIVGTVVSASSASNNAGPEITGTVVNGSVAAGTLSATVVNASEAHNSSGDGIVATVVSGSSASNNAGSGISSSGPGAVTGSSARNNGSHGIFSTGPLAVTGSSANANGGTGINASSAAACTSVSNNFGINAYTVTGSTMNTNSGGQISAIGVTGENTCNSSPCP